MKILENVGTVDSKLRTIKERLRKANVKWVIFAGAAAHCYGSKRKVTDIDILVKVEDLEKAKAALQDMDGFDIVAEVEINAEGKLCRFFMDKEMIERTRRGRLFGVTVPVIPVEDNIIFKAMLQRDATQGKHDIEDIKYMIAKEKLDLDYLKRRIRRCNAEKRVKPLLKSLGIL